MQYRVTERELNELRDKLVNANRNLTSITGNVSSQETLICQLRGKNYHTSNYNLIIDLIIFFKLIS